MNRLVFRAFPGEDSFISFRATLDQNLHNGVPVGLIELVCAILHKLNESIEPFLNNFAWRIVFQLSRR